MKFMTRHMAMSALALAMAANAVPSRAQTAGELVIGWGEPLDTLNPATSSKRITGPVLLTIFDNLVYLNQEFEIEPMLATEWTVSEDGLSYTFKLREGVSFHDGTPFNAQAVVANFDYITKESTAAKTSISLLGPCTRAEAVSEYQVRIVCDQPSVSLLNSLGSPFLGIQSPAAIETYGADLGQHPVGTGPFKLVSWSPNQSVVLERNQDYDHFPPSLQVEGAAPLSKITFTIVPNVQSRISQFQSGESQIMNQTPGLYWKSLGATGQYKQVEVPLSGLGIFAPINTRSAPTDDVAVRKAMIHAIDRDGVALLSDAGVYPASYTILSEGMVGYAPELADMYPYDPAKSAELLKGAGWTLTDGIWTKDGKPLEVTLTVISTRAAYMAIASAFQGYLTDAGFKVSLEPMTSPAWWSANDAGTFSMTQTQYVGTDPDALRIFTPGELMNLSGVDDARVNELIVAGRAEQDRAKRDAIYREIQTILMENAVVMPVRQNLDLVMMAQELSDLNWVGGGYPYFASLAGGED